MSAIVKAVLPVTSPVWVALVTLAVLASKFVLSSSVITPQADVVAAGKDALLPDEDSIVKDVPFAVKVKFVYLSTWPEDGDEAFIVPIDSVANLVVLVANWVLSAADIEPAALVVAAVILIAGVLPPEETIGAVPVTAVSVPPPPPLPPPPPPMPDKLVPVTATHWLEGSPTPSS